MKSSWTFLETLIKLERSEAAVQKCCWEKVFWIYAANLQENNHAEMVTSKTWTRTLKNLDPEKPGKNIGLKNMSDFRELCFIKTMRNVIYCLKVRVLTDI